jgi:putative glutamine amidotransferase
MGKIKYYIPSGSWLFHYQPYYDLMSKAGFTQGDVQTSDVLLLPGGADIGDDLERDSIESHMYHKWISKGKPVVGICRGMQLMLHLDGAQLIQDIPSVMQDVMHTTTSGNWTGQSSWHKTEIGLLTNSRHHQGFTQVPNEWSILDKTRDGIIEAVIKDNQFAVQWHPENPEMDNTFAQEWWIDYVKSII